MLLAYNTSYCSLCENNFFKSGGFYKSRLGVHHTSNLLAAGVLGDSLGALRHGVLGEFSRKEKSHSCLDLATGDGGLLVVVSKAGRFNGNPLEDVIDERIHDAHGLARDTSIRVDLFQHLVDVDGVGLLPGLPPFLGIAAGHLGLSPSFLLSFLACNLLSRHDSCFALCRNKCCSIATLFIPNWVGSLRTAQ